MDLLGTSQFLFCLLKLLIVVQDILLELSFTLYKLILCRHILKREFSDINIAILICINFLEDFFYNLGTVLILNAPLGEEEVHLSFINSSITIAV